MAGEPVPPAPAHMLARTGLLALALVLLFPQLLGPATGGAWPRLVLALGAWRWVAWAACFVAMTLLRFTHLPRRRR